MTAIGLTALERAALQAARAGRVTSRSLALDAVVTRAQAGSALRSLERAGLLRAELIGGGELGYEPAQRPRSVVSRPVAEW